MYTGTDHFALLPAILLAVFGCALMLFEVLVARGYAGRGWLIGCALTGLAFTARALYLQQRYLTTESVPRFTAFGGALTIDPFSLFFNWIFLITAALVILLSYRYLEVEGEHRGEYYGLVLLAQCGMFFLATGSDLVTLFLGLELMSLSFYILVGFLRHDKRSNEAAMKYFLLGVFSSALLVYGFSLWYGIAGSTLLTDLGTSLAGHDRRDPLIMAAMAVTAAGLLFKISAVPFHMWTPDAYEGAPTSVTAYLSIGSKAAAIAFLMRMLLGPLLALRPVWEPILAVTAIASIVVGSFAAITQDNLKRLIAYSSISHAGYILLGLVAGNSTGIEGVLVYVLVYTFMNLGALLVLVAMRREAIKGETMGDISGLMRTHPAVAVLMLIFLLSLAGIPPTAGFLGKYFVLLALLQTGHFVLATVASLYIAVSLFFYFRIVRAMFTVESTEAAPLATSNGVRFSLAVTGAFTVIIGLFPEPFLALARRSLLP